MSSNSIFLNSSLYKIPGFISSTQSLDEFLSIPSGILENDLMIYMVSSNSTADAPQSPGWTVGNSGTYGAMSYAWYWKYYETGETITLDNDNGELKICAAFRNVDILYPFDATSTVATGASGDPNAPSITTVTPSSMVLALGWLDDDNTAITTPTGYTLIANQIDDVSFAKGSIAMAYKEIKVPAAEDPPTFGGTGTDEWVAISIALRPLAASVPLSASGGTTYVSGGYKYHKFTANGDFIVSSLGTVPEVEILAIAGGGGGASGGGGAGGVGENSLTDGALTAGDGGLGTNAYSTWATATSSGQNGYFASGGFGDGAGATRSDGSGVNTGGGGNKFTSGNSGIVIVRYKSLNGTLG